MFTQRFAGIAFLVALALIAAGWRDSTAQEKARPNGREANAKARLEAVKEIFDIWNLRETAPGGFPVVESDRIYGWSVRWLQAERDMNQGPQANVAALEAHSKRMQSLGEKAGNRGDSVDRIAATYFRLEAEDWLATAKAAGK